MLRFTKSFLIALAAAVSCAETHFTFGQTVPTSSSAALSTADTDTIRSNVRRIVSESTSSPAQSLTTTWQEDLKSMSPDGSWPDLDYQDTAILHWRALPHLPRLERIVRATCHGGKPSAEVLQRSLTSLSYWLSTDPQNKNWWHNEIGVPREVGMILLMLGDDAPADLKARGIKLMQRSNWTRQTGANLLDETWIELLRGCLESSPRTIGEAYDRSWQEIRVVDPKTEGIQADGSFHQHGALLYSESYGDVFLQCTERLLTASAGTSLTPPPAVVDALKLFAFGGDTWMTRHWIWDFGACGRAICRENATRLSIESKLATFVELPSDRSQEYVDELKQLHSSDDTAAPVGNRHFWCSDYMVQRRPNYYASARMYSTRTANTDALTTGENQKSHHIADGATCFMLSGDEYFNIYPVWDWLRIPGTTIEQETPLSPKTIKRIGKTSFVGGVSDGSIGCAAMDLEYNHLHAKKAWFMFDHAIVCLGCDITCDTGHDVLTTINQCLLHGKVQMPDGPVSHFDEQSIRAKWIWHDQIGYIIPALSSGGTIEMQSVSAKIGPQSGAWAEIGAGSSEPVTRDVFNLVIDHGSHVTAGRYEYAVFPGIAQESMPGLAARLPYEVVANTAALQAVADPQTHHVLAVFRVPGKLQFGSLVLSVDQPCLLILEDKSSSIRVSVCNPLNLWATANIEINKKLIAANVSTDQGGNSSIKVELPNGIYSGQSVTQEIAVR